VWHQSGWYDYLLGQGLLFPERISASLLPHCFDSGLSPHTAQASWRSPVFFTPELLIMFNCLIDEISWNFQWFQEFKNLRIWYLHLWRAITVTWFFLKPHSVLTPWEIWANCLGTSTWRVNSPNITIFEPFCLIVSICELLEICDRAYGGTMCMRWHAILIFT